MSSEQPKNYDQQIAEQKSEMSRKIAKLNEFSSSKRELDGLSDYLDILQTLADKYSEIGAKPQEVVDFNKVLVNGLDKLGGLVAAGKISNDYTKVREFLKTELAVFETTLPIIDQLAKQNNAKSTVTQIVGQNITAKGDVTFDGITQSAKDGSSVIGRNLNVEGTITFSNNRINGKIVNPE